MNNDIIASLALGVGLSIGGELLNHETVTSLSACVALAMVGAAGSMAWKNEKIELSAILLRVVFSTAVTCMVFFFGRALDFNSNWIAGISVACGFVGYPIGDLINEVYKKKKNKIMKEME